MGMASLYRAESTNFIPASKVTWCSGSESFTGSCALQNPAQNHINTIFNHLSKKGILTFAALTTKKLKYYLYTNIVPYDFNRDNRSVFVTVVTAVIADCNRAARYYSHHYHFWKVS